MSGNNFRQYFKQLDTFGIGYKFMVKGNEKYKTVTGAYITILLILIIFSLFMGFGVDLYKREKPKVSLNSEVAPYERVRLSNENFTFAYRIEDYMGAYFLDETVIDMKVMYYKMEQNDQGQWELLIQEFMKPSKCGNLANTKEKEQSLNISLENWNCVDFTNLSIGGNWDGSFVYSFRVDLAQCMNSTANNNHCKSNEEIAALLENNEKSMFFSFLYLDALPAMGNFQNPLSTTLVNKYEMLSMYATKRSVQTFKTVKMKNDKGWFFSDVEDIELISNDYIASDFSIKSQFNQPWLYTYLCYLGRRVETYNRSYTKIQEVFAAIGGFIKFFWVVATFLFDVYSKDHKNFHLMNLLEANDERDKQSLFKGVNRIPTQNNYFNDFNDKNKNKNVLTETNKTETNKIIKTDLGLSVDTPTRISQMKGGLKRINTNSELYFYKCCRCCKSRNSKSVLRAKKILYDNEAKNINSLFDAINFVRFQNEFHNLKKVLLNEKQLILFSLIKNNSTNIVNNQHEQSIQTVKDLNVETDHVSKKILEIVEESRKKNLLD